MSRPVGKSLRGTDLNRGKMDIRIGDRLIGVDHPAYFIADIAANHDGDLQRAKMLIRLARDHGAEPRVLGGRCFSLCPDGLCRDRDLAGALVGHVSRTGSPAALAFAVGLDFSLES